MDLLDQDFKSPILDIFKELEETTGLPHVLRMMSHEIENKDINYFKRI